VNTPLIALLVFLLLGSLILDWAINALPARELRRRARSDLPDARSAYRISKLVNYGWVVKFLLWLFGTATAVVLVLWSTKTSYLLATAIASLIGLLVLYRRRLPNSSGLLNSLAGWLAVGMAWLLHFIEPLLNKLPHKENRQLNTGLFETADLEDLLKLQAHQPDNRISFEDLDTARAALSFSTKTVASVMVPIKDVRIVLPDEAIGPHLMDELHASGYSSFPVGKKVGKKLPLQIEGTVYLKDLVANPLKTIASQVATDEVSYIAADKKLIEALEEFLRGHTLLLIVSNEREEPVGAVWLEDILERLLGRKVLPEVDNPADADIRTYPSRPKKKW